MAKKELRALKDINTQLIGQCVRCFLVVIAMGKGLVAVRRPMHGTTHCSLWSNALLITATHGATRQAIIVTTFHQRNQCQSIARYISCMHKIFSP